MSLNADAIRSLLWRRPDNTCVGSLVRYSIPKWDKW